MAKKQTSYEETIPQKEFTKIVSESLAGPHKGWTAYHGQKLKLSIIRKHILSTYPNISDIDDSEIVFSLREILGNVFNPNKFRASVLYVPGENDELEVFLKAYVLGPTDGYLIDDPNPGEII